MTGGLLGAFRHRTAAFFHLATGAPSGSEHSNSLTLSSSRGVEHLISMNPLPFSALGLCEPIMRALADRNYQEATPIQSQAIPYLLEGRDLWGCAQTGTGKTAAFALPILQLLSEKNERALPKQPRALILAPTRELAGQIMDSLTAYGTHLNLRHTVVYGGVGFPKQVKTLARGVDVLVATPGRLLDLISQKAVNLERVEFFVADEADRMFDMGFAPDVKRILGMMPKDKQSLLFSATMPNEVKAIAEALLRNPVRIEIAPAATTAERVDHKICHVQPRDKHELLMHLLKNEGKGMALIFTRTKHGANHLSEKLGSFGQRSVVLHGNKSQAARQRALEDFRNGRARVLVATDVASRGIDVKGIAVVVNYDVPLEPEVYVHRIGRTARAGAAGLAYTLVTPAERHLLHGIQKVIRQEIESHDHPFDIPIEERRNIPEAIAPKKGRPFRRSGGRNERSGGGRNERGSGGGRNERGGGNWTPTKGNRPRFRSKSRPAHAVAA